MGSATCQLMATQAEPSPKSYETIFEKDVLVTMTDGVKLAADIYRPDSEAAFPALLVMRPYRKDVTTVSMAYRENWS